MIDLFNIHSIYWPTVIAKENTANENTDETIFGFQDTSNLYDISVIASGESQFIVCTT